MPASSLVTGAAGHDELPPVGTTVQPGDTLRTLDLSEARSYPVTAIDAGTTIENAAAVTVRGPATERQVEIVVGAGSGTADDGETVKSSQPNRRSIGRR